MLDLEEQRLADEDAIYDSYVDPDCYFCGALIAKGEPHEADCPDRESLGDADEYGPAAR